MNDIVLTLSARINWEKKPTELNNCSLCNEIIFTDENRMMLEVSTGNKTVNIDSDFTFCDSCSELMKEQLNERH